MARAIFVYEVRESERGISLIYGTLEQLGYLQRLTYSIKIIVCSSTIALLIGEWDDSDSGWHVRAREHSKNWRQQYRQLEGDRKLRQTGIPMVMCISSRGQTYRRWWTVLSSRRAKVVCYEGVWNGNGRDESDRVCSLNTSWVLLLVFD